MNYCKRGDYIHTDTPTTHKNRQLLCTKRGRVHASKKGVGGVICLAGHHKGIAFNVETCMYMSIECVHTCRCAVEYGIANVYVCMYVCVGGGAVQ